MRKKPTKPFDVVAHESLFQELLAHADTLASVYRRLDQIEDALWYAQKHEWAEACEKYGDERVISGRDTRVNAYPRRLSEVFEAIRDVRIDLGTPARDLRAAARRLRSTR